MKKLILAGAVLLLALPAYAADADLSIPAEKKTIEAADKDAAKKSATPAKKKKKTYKKKERGTGYKFKAEDSHLYKFDKSGKPLTGGKKAAKKKSKAAKDPGYKFRQENTKSSYRLDDEANPIGKAGTKKAPAPKKPAAKKKTGKEEPPPYDDSLSVDKKVISLEGE